MAKKITKFGAVSKVSAYRASDGALFDSKKLADEHQSNIDFTHWYVNGNQCRGRIDTGALGNSDRSHIALEDMREWLVNNREMVNHLLSNKMVPM